MTPGSAASARRIEHHRRRRGPDLWWRRDGVRPSRQPRPRSAPRWAASHAGCDREQDGAARISIRNASGGPAPRPGPRRAPGRQVRRCGRAPRRHRARRRHAPPIPRPSAGRSAADRAECARGGVVRGRSPTRTGSGDGISRSLGPPSPGSSDRCPPSRTNNRCPPRRPPARFLSVLVARRSR